MVTLQDIKKAIDRLSPEERRELREYIEQREGAEQPASEETVRPTESTNWENQPWTDEEIRAWLTPRRMSFKELAAWLETNPPKEPYGDLRDDEDAVDYVRRMRQQSTIQLDEPGEDE